MGICPKPSGRRVMFTTFCSDANSGLRVDSEQSAHHLSRRPTCRNCHSKKVRLSEGLIKLSSNDWQLRCTREKNGCYRCKSSRTTCEYETPRLKRKRLGASIGQITNCDATSEPTFTQTGSPEGAVQLHKALAPVLQNGTSVEPTTDAALYSPRFSVDGSLFDFFDVNFEESINDSMLPYPMPRNFGTLQSDTASEALDSVLQPGGKGDELCQCLASAVSLLESVSIQYVQANLYPVPRIIRHNKVALLQCRALYTCMVCSK